MIIMKQNGVHIGTKIWTCQTKILHSVLTYIPAWNFKPNKNANWSFWGTQLYFFIIFFHYWAVMVHFISCLIQEHVAPQNWRPQICLKWVWMARALKSMLSQPECTVAECPGPRAAQGSLTMYWRVRKDHMLVCSWHHITKAPGTAATFPDLQWHRFGWREGDVSSLTLFRIPSAWWW